MLITAKLITDARWLVYNNQKKVKAAESRMQQNVKSFIRFRGEYTRIQDFLKDWARVIHGYDGNYQLIKGGVHLAGGVEGTLDTHVSERIGDELIPLRRNAE